MVKEELEASERYLSAASHEGNKVGGPEEPVAVDGTEDIEVARREDHATHGYTLEAGPTDLDFRHQVSVPAGQ
jgi:hypothetical protein